MAGNQTNERQRAERELATAKSGGTAKDIASAQANYDTKRREELAAMGK